MDINSAKFRSIEQLQDQYLGQNTQRASARTNDGRSFLDILSDKTEGVKFSKHAASRLRTRDISLSDEQMGRLSEGAKRAEAKGIKESLVLVDEMAFIVNVPSGTVVTALEKEEANEKIFTNIDGAVIA